MALVNYNDGTNIIENVTICYQGDTDTCAQACVTSILNYWGYPADYNQIINQTSNQSRTSGMTPEQIVWYFRNCGLQSRSYKGNMANIKSQIDRGYPCIVAFDENKVNHVVVIVGYNDLREVIFYIDSAEGQIIEEDYSTFIRAWNNRRLDSSGMLDSYNNLIIEVKR